MFFYFSIVFIFIYLPITAAHTTPNRYLTPPPPPPPPPTTTHHQLPRKKSPDDAFRHVVWASGMFLYKYICIYTYLPPYSTTTTLQYHPDTSPPTARDKSPNDKFKHIVWASGMYLY
jgi:hypothetical protein